MRLIRKHNLRQVCLMMVGFGCLAAAPRMVRAADAPAAAPTIAIGVIDEDKLGSKYVEFQDALKEIDKRAQGFETQLDARRRLEEKDGKRFDELITKPKLAADEQKEMDEFVRKSNDRKNEYLGLVGRVTRTDADNARIKALQEVEQGNQTTVDRLENSLLEQLKKSQEETFDKYMDNANKVIEQAAESKKLQLVVRKRALIWSAGALDITDEVLAKLNKS